MIDKCNIMFDDYPLLETIEEGKHKIKIYDPKPFLIPEICGRKYCFPFDNTDESPTAKRFSGNSLGRIEWMIEPRKYKWDRTEKRFYITQVLIWAQQTRDKRYSGKIFGINCMSEAISGDAHKFREYEEGMINQTWRMGISPVTKTPVLDTYPNNHYDLLLIDAQSSISFNAKYLRSDILPKDYTHYDEIMKLHFMETKYNE